MPDNLIISTFKKYFPGKIIKPLQYDIVDSLMNGDNNEVIGILPTGYGKSLCYQLSYLMHQDKNVIIISPLISLMEDQKSKLDNLNIPSACFHSNITKKKKVEIKNELISPDNDTGMIIFLTPEYLVGCEEWFKTLIAKQKLLLVAIDEAHCISTWGHEFRPEYQGLFRIKEWTKNEHIPILALTATATNKVEFDIKDFLLLENPKIFKTSFDRHNLIISVNRKPSTIIAIFPILNEYKNDFSIVYCKTRIKAEKIAKLLKDNGYNAGVYHAGLTATERKKIQEQFANKKLNVIVATIAFGMGIDQDVHLVVHWGCPSDMESYYQEIGRAGRDGTESKCIMYFDNDDFRISRYFLKSINDKKYMKFKDDQISLMEQYCLMPICRRKTILKHFGEETKDFCGKCDNCMKQIKINNTIIDGLLYQIYLIVRTIFLIRGSVGTNKIALILKGSKSKIISNFIKCKTYGSLKDYPESDIKKIITILIVNKYIDERTITNGFGSSLCTTRLLLDWYNKINSNIDQQNITHESLIPVLKQNKPIINVPHEFSDIKQIKEELTILKETFDLE